MDPGLFHSEVCILNAFSTVPLTRSNEVLSRKADGVEMFPSGDRLGARPWGAWEWAHASTKASIFVCGPRTGAGVNKGSKSGTSCVLKVPELEKRTESQTYH